MTDFARPNPGPPTKAREAPASAGRGRVSPAILAKPPSRSHSRRERWGSPLEGSATKRIIAFPKDTLSDDRTPTSRAPQAANRPRGGAFHSPRALGGRRQESRLGR